MSSGKLSQYKSTIAVESRHRAYLIGHKGKRISKLQEECNNVMIVIPKSDRPEDVVEVIGNEADVKKAIQKITAVCKAFQEFNKSKDQATRTAVPTSAELASPEGRDELCNNCCRELQNDPAPCDGELACTTPSEDMPGAKNQSPADHAATGIDAEISPKKESEYEESLIVSKQVISTLYAYNRKLLRAISLECDGVRFSVKDTNEIIAIGARDGLAYAVDQLQHLDLEPESISSVQHVTIKRQHHKFVVGSYGVHSKLQRVNLGIRIVLPDASEPSSELIYIFGRKKDAQEVKRKLEVLAVSLSKYCRQSITIPSEYTYRFSEQRGKVLKQVASDIGCGVHLHLEVEDKSSAGTTRRVIFNGPPVCFPAAEDHIRGLVSEYATFRMETCRIPFELFDAVRGPSGVFISQLMEDYEVKIVFPPSQPPRNKHIMDHVGDVKVSGQVDNVEKACDELMASVPVCREVRVPLEYYSFFAGHKSSYLDQLKEEFQVIIKVKPAEEFHGVIVVIGPEDDVISCCQYIEQQVGLLSQEQNHREKLRFSMTIDIPAKHQKKLVGKKGMKLGHLCSQFHVDITMPPKVGSDDTTILLQGYEERCRKAAVEIHRILAELEDKTTIKMDTIHGDFHRKLVGHHGRNIRAVSSKYQVEIKVPRGQEGEITITGGSKDVQKCAEHIRLLADSFVKDEQEELDKKEMLKQYTYTSKKRLPSIAEVFQVDRQPEKKAKSGTSDNGFVVSGAPWCPPAGDGPTNVKVPTANVTESPTTPTWPKPFTAVVASC